MLQGWKGKILSKVGKEVLIKVVAQSLPTYAMGVFQLPLKLCDELNALCAKFWWGQVGDERKVHWKSWDSLSQPKNDGGMGFRDLRSFNLAMLAKQGWRLLHDHDSLLSQCFKARYFPRCHFLDAVDSPNSSYVWKSMVAALPILKSGCCWRVGNGVSIRVHKDKWIPNYPANKILHLAQEESEEWLVSELIDSVSHCWMRDVIMSSFHREDAEAICNIHLSHRQVSDSVVWLHNRKGVYSVRSGYYIARRVMRKDDWAESSRGSGGLQIWKKLWKLGCLIKLRFLDGGPAMKFYQLVSTLLEEKSYQIRCVIATNSSQNLLFMLYGSVLLLKMCGQEVQSICKSVQLTNVILFSYLNFFLTSYLMQILSCFLFDHGLYGIKETRWCMEDK